MSTSANDPAESPQRIEPTRLEAFPEAIVDLVARVARDSAALGMRIHPRTAASLADLVRIMNAYYSNLIEGHNTLPRDIARALRGEYAVEPERRALQVEAVAHVRLQAEIDRMALEGVLPEPASREFLKWLHAEFYRAAPDQLLRVRALRPDYRMTPGAFIRSQTETGA